MTPQTLFLCFATAMYALVVFLAFRYLGRRAATLIASGLALWFSYVALLSHLGVLQRPDARPPGMIFILGPVLIYFAALSYIAFARQPVAIKAIPLWVLIGAQAFRVIVEFFIHRLWLDGLVPQTLTYNGANVDIYMGASAPLIAFLCARPRWSPKLIALWNLLGLLALANVVSRAILTAPGPLNLLHADPPNRMFATFPFMFIPAFFVPLAVTLHLLAIHRLRSRPSFPAGS